MRLFCIIQVGPVSKNKCPSKREKRRPQKDRDIDWSHADVSQEHVELPEAGRRKEGFSPGAFKGNMAPVTL